MLACFKWNSYNVVYFQHITFTLYLKSINVLKTVHESPSIWLTHAAYIILWSLLEKDCESYTFSIYWIVFWGFYFPIYIFYLFVWFLTMCILSSDRIEQQPSKLRAAGSSPAECTLQQRKVTISLHRPKVLKIVIVLSLPSDEMVRELSQLCTHS